MVGRRRSKKEAPNFLPSVMKIAKHDKVYTIQLQLFTRTEDKIPIRIKLYFYILSIRNSLIENKIKSPKQDQNMIMKGNDLMKTIVMIVGMAEYHKIILHHSAVLASATTAGTMVAVTSDIKSVLASHIYKNSMTYQKIEDDNTCHGPQKTSTVIFLHYYVCRLCVIGTPLLVQ